MSKTKQTIFDSKLFRRLLDYVKPYRAVFLIALFTVLALAVFGALRPKVLQIAIDQNIEVKIKEGFLTYILLYMGLLILEVLSQLMFIYFAGYLGQSVVRDIRTKLFKHILSFKMKYFDTSSVGVLITRTVTDLERIADIFGQGLFMIFSDLLKMIAVAIIMLFMNWKLSILVFLSLPIILFATKIFQKFMKRAFEDVRNEISNLNAFVQERITGMKIVQLFGREEIEMKKFKEINDRHKKGWLKTVWYNSIFFPVADFLTSITLGFVIWRGGLNTIFEGSASLGILTAFIMMIPMLFRPLNQIANKFNTLQMGMVAADRVFRVLDTSASNNDTGTIEAPHFNGEIEFKDVYFSYIEGESVLNGISFKVKAGQTVAIVGATGAGKSTIINLLNRFYEINSGTIQIDGVNINNYSIASLRRQIALVLQDVFLFADTIYNNISLKSPEITLSQVKQAAKEIGIHKFIMSLPGGYQYNVKERGVMLSSGQRQLIAFLRAYVTNPGILILDEATSSVDSYSERLIQKATTKITQNRTSIVIAHRLATIKKADTILVLDCGNIVEHGRHNDLLNIKNGYYRNLYEVQFMKEAQNLAN